jgi:hypothetical protein
MVRRVMMKTLILIVIVLFLISNVYSASPIEVHGYLETGYNLIGKYEAFDYCDTFYIDIQVYLQWRFLSIGGNIETNVLTIESFNRYVPIFQTFMVFAMVQVTENLEVGFIHLCMHDHPWPDLRGLDIVDYDAARRFVYAKWRF